jgi:phosphate acetyltransferase
MATVQREKYQRLIDSCKSLPPTPTAVAHPCDASSLEGAMAAARMGLIVPFLVGPRERIVSVATANGIDLAGAEIVETPHSEASATEAVKLVREGKAEALMKGSLHTDELMAAVVLRETGLRTARRVSHCFVMDVPGRDEALIITDAAVNIAPTLEEKADILQNAIDLAHALGIADVRVAVLSAMETVNPKVPSTIEAAASADDGPPSGFRALIDGPLALDNAIDPEATRIKKIDSPLFAPTCCWCRTWKRAACSPEPTPWRGRCAGIVLGARVRSSHRPGRFAHPGSFLPSRCSNRRGARRGKALG